MNLFNASLTSNNNQPSVLPDVNMFLIGDPQLSLVPNSLRGDPRQWMIRDSIEHCKANHPEFTSIFQAGDYMDARAVDEPLQYGEMNNIFQSGGVDVYGALGNHDVNIPSRLNQSEINTFYSSTIMKDFDTLYSLGYAYEKRLDNDLHIIILNNMEDFGNHGSEGQFRLLDSQMIWLQNVLDSITESNARIFVGIHAPIRSECFRTGSVKTNYVNWQVQSDDIDDMLATWQKNSNKGLVLGVFSGHTHIDCNVLSSRVNGNINHITLDEFDEINKTLYPGDENTINTNTIYMSYGFLKFNETTKILTIQGYGQQTSYSIDMNSRIT